jgi:copper chaperone NosL
MWDISLEAPQYPEGLGMKIWINKLSGDIPTINGLNHYIGMQKIEEDSIPELKYMPVFLAMIIVLGILTAFLRKKWLFYTWVSLFAILGVVAGYDFYNWEYDYGHNLNPKAAIKVPGMSYQPPLIGSKQLLNFTAHSYPDHGGQIILVVGISMVVMAAYMAFIEKKHNNKLH